MAPHTENHQHGQHPSCLLPKPLGIAKNHNVSKPPAGSSPTVQRGRDLQSAMQHAPTIRVIHIFAPKVIKTDVANFRSTVQKLTGRGKTRPQRRAARASKDCAPVRIDDEFVAMNPPDDVVLPPHGGPANTGACGDLYWDQTVEKEVLTLQRMVGDACGMTTTDHLVRCDSVDSATYSLDSGNTFSGDTSSPGVTTTSPTGTMDAVSFSFYPQREIPYSLSEIPAPFFGAAVSHAAVDMLYPTGSCSSLPMASYGAPGSNYLMSSPTSHLMDHNSLSTLGFEADVPLPTLSTEASASNSSAGGSLFDLMPRQHCRLSVQPHNYRGASFFEPI